MDACAHSHVTHSAVQLQFVAELGLAAASAATILSLSCSNKANAAEEGVQLSIGENEFPYREIVSNNVSDVDILASPNCP
jgi:hypothetical protein